ncbi:hypothetical protein M5E88_17910 [Akkermansia muciniphila]|nr:hypothetical protein M5E88_17910 [Akkermansia muciniphila]
MKTNQSETSCPWRKPGNCGGRGRKTAISPVPARLGPVSIGSLHSSVSCGCCSDDPRYYVTVQELIERMDWTPFSTPGSCTAHGTASAGSSAPRTRPRLRRPRLCIRTPSACWNRP